jgi:DNA-binding MarR family transcriptional regulator
VVDRLVRKEWLSRKVSQRDRRASELYLTEEGKHVLRQVAPGVKRAQRILVSGLSAEEADTFLALLRKATEAIESFGRAPAPKSRAAD